jgi:hypothetical protein
MFKVYSEHLLQPLMETITALSGPKTKILVASVPFPEIISAKQLFENYWTAALSTARVRDPFDNCPWEDDGNVEKQFHCENDL